jgi:hypothetical protein
MLRTEWGEVVRTGVPCAGDAAGTIHVACEATALACVSEPVARAV